jgi:hypothetical protein
LTGGFVDALDRLARLGNGRDKIGPLGRQEAVPRFQLVELLDRHHVDRPEAIDLGSQRGDGILGAEGALGSRSDSGLARFPFPVTMGFLDVVAVIAVRPVCGVQDAGVGRCATLPFELLHFDDDVVDGGLQQFEGRGGQVRQVAFGRRAREVKICNRRPDGFESGPPFLDDRFVFFRARPPGGDRLVGVADVLLQTGRAQARPRRARLS